MAVVLRDIVAKMGLDLDEGSFNKADAKITGLGTAFKNIATGVAVASIAVGAKHLVDLAGEANEARGVLDAVFGPEAQQEVRAWGRASGDAMGRSRFQMLKMAGDLGKVLNPLMDRNVEEAKRMAQGFTELAVDLASFHDTADDVAFTALRSGLAGQAEPLQKFGIFMSVARLEAFRLAQGITTSVKEMTEAQKTTLRYKFILDQAATAMGNAADTTKNWTNAGKALLGQLEDLGTDIGFILLPAAEALVGAVREVVTTFNQWREGTKVLEAALLLLGTVVTTLAVKMLIAFAAPLLAFFKFAVMVGLVILVIDDFLVLLDGGDSVIGRFIDSVFGPGSATAAVKELHFAMEGMVLYWESELLPAIKYLGSQLKNVAVDAIKWWGEFFGKMGGWFTEIENSDAVKLVTSMFERLSGPGSFTAKLHQASVGSAPLRVAALGPSATGAGGSRTTVINESTTVNVAGNATASDAGHIASAASSGRGALQRRTAAATAQAAE